MSPNEGSEQDVSCYSAELSAAREQMATLEATARRLRKQNRQLQADLRVAQSSSVIAESLHREHLQQKARNGGSVENSFAALGEEQSECAKRRNEEVEALKEQLRQMKETLQEERERSALLAADASVLEASTVKPDSACTAPTPEESADSANRQRATPAATAPMTADQRRAQRRLQQLAAISRLQHKEHLRQRAQGFSDAGSVISDVTCGTAGYPRASRAPSQTDSIMGRSPAMGRSPGTQSNLSSIRTQQSTYLASVNALQRRFALRRDLKCGS